MQKRRRLPEHIYLPPAVAAAVGPRSAQLDLPLSAYFSILLRNHLYAGVPSAVELPTEKHAQVRERIPFSVQSDLWRDAQEAAKFLGGSVSLLLEALVMAELRSPAADFVIYVRAAKAKLR